MCGAETQLGGQHGACEKSIQACGGCPHYKHQIEIDAFEVINISLFQNMYYEGRIERETVKLASPNLLARNRGMIKLENWMRKAKDGKSLNDFISQIKTLGLENDSKLRDFVSMWCVVDNESALPGAGSTMVKHIIHNFFLILY